MQKYIVPKNYNFFEFQNTEAKSIFVRPDEISGMQKNETSVSENYFVNLLSNAFLSYIKKWNNGFDARGSKIIYIHEFMHITNFIIQKMPLSEKSVILESEPDAIPVIDMKQADYCIQKNKPSNESIISETKPVPAVDEKQYVEIKTMLQDETAESGMVNHSERIIELLYAEDKQKTNILLNELFLKNFNDSHIVVGVLHIISHFEYDHVSPEGPTMAIAAISHKDMEVKEYGVKCFENWRHKDGIRVLEQIKVEEHWLQNYIDLVICDLRALG